MNAENKTSQDFLRKAGRAATWLAHALIFPLNIHLRRKGVWNKVSADFGKLGVYLLSWNLVLPLGVMGFPRAEKVLKEEGLDPALVQQLAPGKQVYVIKEEDGLLGKMATLSSISPAFLWPPIYSNRISNDFVVAFANAQVSSMFNDVCAVYIKPPESQARAVRRMQTAVHEKTGGYYTYHPPVKVRERYQATLLHEIRHCSKDNQALPSGVLQEGDADYHGIMVLAGSKKDPSLTQRFLVAASFSDGDKAHGVALYLDARFRQKPVPAQVEIESANVIAKAIVGNDDLLWAYAGGYCAAGADCRKSAKPGLPPLVKRRLELYEDSYSAVFVPVSPAPKIIPPAPLSPWWPAV